MAWTSELEVHAVLGFPIKTNQTVELLVVGCRFNSPMSDPAYSLEQSNAPDGITARSSNLARMCPDDKP